MPSKRASGTTPTKKRPKKKSRSVYGRMQVGTRRKLIGWSLALGIPLFGLACAMGGYFLGAVAAHDLDEIKNLADRGRLERLSPEAFDILHGEKPILLRADDFPDHLKDALVAREDSRFWRHHGIDLIGVGRATLRNIEEKSMREGAGTITMQVARTVYGDRAKTLRRKIVEMLLAFRIERNFTKEDILEAYMNWVFLGNDNHGFEQASREYFGKTARDLSLGESAVLVGMLRAPNRFHPQRNYEAALLERDAVLSRMVAEGMLSSEQAEAEMARNVAVPRYR